MEVYLNRITGLDDAIISMYMSKQTWTPELDKKIRDLYDENVDKYGSLVAKPSQDFLDMVDKTIKYGVHYGHTTLLRYIDISFVSDGLHRGGTDDWDSHAKRMDNRIVRASTRLSTYKEGDISDYYKGKILFPFEAMKELGLEIPNNIEIDGVRYVRTEFGYINEEYKDEQDVKRGLYPLSIPTKFIFKVQYPELAHIYQHRNNDSTANPEVKELAEKCKKELLYAFPILAENLGIIKMQK